MVIGRVHLTRNNDQWIYKVVYGRTPVASGVVDNFYFDNEKRTFQAGNAFLFRNITNLVYK